MLVFRTLFLTFLLGLLLSACSSGSSSPESTTTDSDLTQPVFVEGSDPAIETVYTKIVHEHPSYLGTWGSSTNSAISFFVSIGATDPLGRENLAGLYIYNISADWSWSLIDVNAGLQYNDYYNAVNGTYERVFYFPQSLDRIDLKGWEVVAVNLLGDEVRRPFEFLLSAGMPAGDSDEFVYAREYMGPLDGGVKALEALTVADNKISFNSNLVYITPETPDSPKVLDLENSTFTIEFDTTDARAQYYSIRFYDGSSEIDYVGQLHFNSPSVLNAPIIQGQTTRIIIPGTEAYFPDESQNRLITGIHIALLDQPISRPGGLWFNHRSISEFVPLTP